VVGGSSLCPDPRHARGMQETRCITQALSSPRLLRVFISSPADVRPERLIAERVVQRLAREFSYHFRIEPVMWEREPLVATAHFQDGLVKPSESDVVVVILWSRLGVPLPFEKYPGAVTGRPVTGTEWEFEDALASNRARTLPDLLLYRKRAEITGSLEDESVVRELLEQKRLVEDFMSRWTRAADGKAFTAASWEFQKAADFEELLEQHMRKLIQRRIPTATENPAGIRWHLGSPFRGLESFDLEHAAVFCGRTRARNDLRELVARQEARGSAFILVMGASGSGKSSLVKAGLLADLKTPGMIGRVALCRHAVLRPSDGKNLISTLAAALLRPTALPELASLHYDPAGLADLLLNEKQGALPIKQGLDAAAQTERLTPGAEARLLVIIDQLEEIFTVEAGNEFNLDAFLTVLKTLAASKLVWIVATMRSDFFDRLEKLPRLLALSAGEARYLIAPAEPTELGQMIRLPARDAGLRFEEDATRGITLDELIQRAAAKDSGALPLLSFLLDQLWGARSEDGLLTFEAYERLGGLEGSLGRRATEVFSALTPAVQKALPQVLRELVTVNQGTATARTALLANFREATPKGKLLSALLDANARLVVADGLHVRVAHEALLTHWDAAREQVQSDLRDLELRERLMQAANYWENATKDRASLLLSPGLPLDGARDLMARWPESLEPLLTKYVSASVAAKRQRRLRLSATITGALVAVPLLVALVWVARVWNGVRSVEAGMALTRVRAGCFSMGSSDGEKDERPPHKVCLEAFDLGTFEVTQEEWRAVMRSNPSAVVGHDEGGLRRPVENVSWDDVAVFIRRMNWFGARTWRLPSEAEWEYAARAGSTTAFPWGDTPESVCLYANVRDAKYRASRTNDDDRDASHSCNDGHYQTSPVGSFRPNAFGLHDMSGNVWEWVADAEHDSYKGAPTDGRVWEETPKARRGFRGGGFHSIGPRLRSAERDWEPADYHNIYNGFRLASSVK
jgi:formylglycine-generating enzyme required for sulfatase activity